MKQGLLIGSFPQAFEAIEQMGLGAEGWEVQLRGNLEAEQPAGRRQLPSFPIFLRSSSRISRRRSLPTLDLGSMSRNST